MNRLAAVPAAALAAGVLGVLATAAPALAATHDSGEAAPLGTRLHYGTTTWTSQGADMSISAPRGWRFVLTPDGQARFNAGSRPDVLTMGYRGEGRLRPQVRQQVADLQGTPGLRILEAHGAGRGDRAYGELRYRWTRPDGERRYVDYRFVGNDAYMVAGRNVDRKGLQYVLGTAADTGDCS